jgi:hypothetical protein
MRRNAGPDKPRAICRRALEVLAIVVLVGTCLGVASIGNTAPSQTRASISVSIVTPSANLGPFVTTQAVPATIDPGGVLHLASADTSFGDIGATLSAHKFLIDLVPVDDVLVAVDAKQGTASVSGDFTLRFATTNPNVACQIDRVTVDATTDPPGAAPYSPATGNASLIAAAPSIPAVTSCGGTATAINAALSLPITPPVSSTTTPTNSPTPTIPVPRIEVHLTLSPPVQVASTTATTTITKSTTTPAPVVHSAPPPPAAAPVAPPASAARVARAARSAPAPSRAGSHATKKSAARGSTTPTTLNPAFVRGNSPDSPSLTTPLALPDALPRANEPLAFSPAASQEPDTPSRPGLVVLLVFGTIGLGLALWLIKSDLRALIPVASRPARSGGVTRPARSGGVARPTPRRR